MKKTVCAVAFLVSFTFFSCNNDSEADLVNPVPLVVKYSSDVKPITTANCIECHADTPINGAPMPLTTYTAVKNAILNRGLLDRISRPQGAPGMMPNGRTRLPQSKIDLIGQWKTDGFVE